MRPVRAAGFQQAETSELADDRRLTATQLGLEAAASAQRGQQRAQVEYQVYVRSVEQRTEAANAQLQALFAGEGTPEQRAFELEQERWQALAESSAAATEIQPDSELGPLLDRSFPTRYFASAARESHRLNALQDGYNEQANILDGRAASYTAILAVLAVAVYLLGLTLALRERLLRNPKIEIVWDHVVDEVTGTADGEQLEPVRPTFNVLERPFGLAVGDPAVLADAFDILDAWQRTESPRHRQGWPRIECDTPQTKAGLISIAPF